MSCWPRRWSQARSWPGRSCWPSCWRCVSLFLNLSFRTAKGEPVAEGDLRSLIERADATKIERARERLQAARAASGVTEGVSRMHTADGCPINAQLSQFEGRFRELYVLFVDPKNLKRTLPETWNEVSREAANV